MDAEQMYVEYHNMLSSRLYDKEAFAIPPPKTSPRRASAESLDYDMGW